MFVNNDAHLINQEQVRGGLLRRLRLLAMTVRWLGQYYVARDFANLFSEL